MRKLSFFLLATLITANSVKSQIATLTWAKSLGNATSTDDGRSVCIDNQKNVIVTGTFKGTVDFNPGSGVENLISTGTYSAFVVKFDSLGNFLWAKSFGGPSYASPLAITADAGGNIITTGKFFEAVDFDPSVSIYNLTSMGTGGGAFPAPAPSIFIQKLDVNGNFVWAKRIGANSNGSAGSGSANDIISDEDDNIYIAGEVEQNGTLDFNPDTTSGVIVNSTNGKAFVLKLNSDGSFGWVTTFGNIGGTGASANSICYANDYLYVAGSTSTGILTITSLLVRKIDLLGIGIWEKRVSGTHNVIGNEITADAEGNVISGGQFNDGSIDINPASTGVFTLTDSNGRGFLQKLDADGNFVWAEGFNSTVSSLAIDADNNIYAAGTFSGTADFDFAGPVWNLSTSGNAGYVQKLDANGYLLWAGQFANSGNEKVNKLVVAPGSNIYICGYYSGTQDFAPDSSTTLIQSVSNSQDAFVAKLKDSYAYITTANGDWHTGSTWRGGVVPPGDASVIVRHSVTVTQNESCYSIIVEHVGGNVLVTGGFNLSVIH